MNGPSQKRVSSPISTGGEGVFFEQHVAAYWLAQLLVRSIPPILTDTGVTEVHFQTENLGFNTDDILVVCARVGAATARLVGQVKRSFTVSAADDECKKAIGDFWKDFKEADPFNPQHDRFVLVTLRGTNTLLGHFVGLLDCARGAADGEEFERRLSLDGFISRKSVHQCNELCEIITKLEGTPVAVFELDSQYHDLPENAARDAMKNSLLAATGLPFFRLRVESPESISIDEWYALLSDQVLPHIDLGNRIRCRQAAYSLIPC